MDHFPNNTLSHFYNKLPQPVDLTKGQWEVGLAELSCPHSWPNVQGQSVYIIVKPDKSHREKLILPEGYYQSTEILVRQLNALVASAQNEAVRQGVRFVYNTVSQKIQVSHSVRSVQPSEEFQRLTGFRQGMGRKSKNGNLDHEEASHTPDLEGGIYNLFVYSSVAQYRQVGDQMTPLLRILPVSKEFNGNHHVRNLQNVHYVPVSQNIFETVEIYIGTTLGQPVPFQSGQVIATLHFRQRQS